MFDDLPSQHLPQLSLEHQGTSTSSLWRGTDQMPLKSPDPEQTITSSPHAKYLGVWLDDHLRLSTPRNKIIAQANSRWKPCATSLAYVGNVAVFNAQDRWGCSDFTDLLRSPGDMPAGTVSRLIRGFTKIQKRDSKAPRLQLAILDYPHTDRFTNAANPLDDHKTGKTSVSTSSRTNRPCFVQSLYASWAVACLWCSLKYGALEQTLLSRLLVAKADEACTMSHSSKVAPKDVSGWKSHLIQCI